MPKFEPRAGPKFGPKFRELLGRLELLPNLAIFLVQNRKPDLSRVQSSLNGTESSVKNKKNFGREPDFGITAKAANNRTLQVTLLRNTMLNCPPYQPYCITAIKSIDLRMPSCSPIISFNPLAVHRLDPFFSWLFLKKH